MGRTFREASSFGFCIDIDGVVMRGNKLLPGVRNAISKLVENHIPYIFMTNGGGHLEIQRARILSETLGQNISAEQIVLSHSPLRHLINDRPEMISRKCNINSNHKFFNDKRVLVLGCGDVLNVAKEYGFNKVVSPQQLVKHHPELYPWRTMTDVKTDSHDDFFKDPIEAIIIMHDPVDWHLEIQVCLDVLLGLDPSAPKLISHKDHTDKINSLPSLSSHIKRQAVPVYNSNEDLVFASTYTHPRLAQGSFISALASIFEECSGGLSLEVERYGKPNLVTFGYAYGMIRKLNFNKDLSRIYMIGDNINSDIKGANNAGEPWYSVLVETGVSSSDNDAGIAKLRCKNIDTAVRLILDRETKISSLYS